MIVVTTFDIPGYRVDAVLGEVMGMTVRSANVGANFVAGFRSLGGGEITEFTKIVYDSRQEVMHRMVTEAQRRGANAVVAMRFDTGSIGQNFTEVCAYGTAVVVRPIPEGEEGATVQSAQLARQESEAGPARSQQPSMQTGGVQTGGMQTGGQQPGGQPAGQPYGGQQPVGQPHGGQQSYQEQSGQPAGAPQHFGRPNLDKPEGDTSGLANPPS